MASKKARLGFPQLIAKLVRYIDEELKIGKLIRTRPHIDSAIIDNTLRSKQKHVGQPPPLPIRKDRAALLDMS